MDHTWEITSKWNENLGRYGGEEYTVTIRDNGRVVMTFITGNADEAQDIGPRLIEFLGF